MSFKQYKEESRKSWGTDKTSSLNMEQITLGAVLRIADSLEEIAMSLKAMNMRPRTSETMQARKIKRLESSLKKTKEQRDYFADIVQKENKEV